MRTIAAYAIAPLLKVTGYRFSKHYRWGTTRLNRIVYSLVNTVKANLLAGI